MSHAVYHPSTRYWSAPPHSPVPYFFAPGRAYAAVDYSGQPLGVGRVLGDVGVYHWHECLTCIVVCGSRMYTGTFRIDRSAGYPDYSRVFCSPDPPPGLKEELVSHGIDRSDRHVIMVKCFLNLGYVAVPLHQVHGVYLPAAVGRDINAHAERFAGAFHVRPHSLPGFVPQVVRAVREAPKGRRIVKKLLSQLLRDRDLLQLSSLFLSYLEHPTLGKVLRSDPQHVAYSQPGIQTYPQYEFILRRQRRENVSNVLIAQKIASDSSITSFYFPQFVKSFMSSKPCMA